MNKLHSYLYLYQKEIIFNIKVINHFTFSMFIPYYFPKELILLINWYYIEYQLHYLPTISCGYYNSLLLTKQGLFISGRNKKPHNHIDYFQPADRHLSFFS